MRLEIRRASEFTCLPRDGPVQRADPSRNASTPGSFEAVRQGALNGQEPSVSLQYTDAIALSISRPQQRRCEDMAAMMPSGGGGGGRSANPYEHYDAPVVEDDLIDPDDGTVLDREIQERNARIY